LQSEWADPEQLVPFAVLNDEHQKKDLDIYKTTPSTNKRGGETSDPLESKEASLLQGRKKKSPHEDKVYTKTKKLLR
jgi:hypothetical protein